MQSERKKGNILTAQRSRHVPADSEYSERTGEDGLKEFRISIGILVKEADMKICLYMEKFPTVNRSIPFHIT